MQLKLLGWSSAGLRSSDMRIDTADSQSSVPKVCLVQMPNGTGKTTTLKCLRAALTGEAEHWDSEEVRSFFPRDTVSDRGKFEVRLLYDEKPLTFSMLFDLQDESVRYSTTFDRGKQPRYAPPPELLRFFTEHFVNLLVFDGELPSALLDPKQTRAEDALDAFFQLYLLPEIATAVDDIWKAHASKASAKDHRGLARRNNRVNFHKSRIRKIKRAQREAVEEISRLKERQSSLESDIKQRVGKTEVLRQRLDELEADLKKGRSVLNEQLGSIMTDLRCPHLAHLGFSETLTRFRDQLDRLKLPESTSRQFFEELIEEDVCICGRELDNQSREQITMNANKYLGKDIFGVVNLIKTTITNTTTLRGELTTAERADLIRSTTHDIGTTNTQIAGLKRELIEAGDDELKRLETEKESIGQQIGELEDVLDEISREPIAEDDENTHCLVWHELELDRWETKLAEITKTVDLKRHRKIVIEVLESAYENARIDLAKILINAMNERLSVLLPDHGIRISSLDKSLLLEKQSGASKGQTLAVGYAFLTTLFARGKHEFPFVVDAPVTALDGKVRNEVASIIPSVCSQFVAFTLDTERSNFTDRLAEAAGEDIKYITAFDDAPRNKNLLGSLPAEGVTRSETGVVVEGIDYFNSVSFAQTQKGE